MIHILLTVSMLCQHYDDKYLKVLYNLHICTEKYEDQSEAYKTKKCKKQYRRVVKINLLRSKYCYDDEH